MQSWKSSKSANLLDKISWHLREEKVISWWTHQLHEVHQLERVLSRRQVHKVCRNTKLCHGVRLNSTLTLHTPKHQALHTVKHSQTLGNCRIQQTPSPAHKHQALHTVKHSKTLRNGRIQQTPSPAHKHIGKPSGMAGHSQTPSPAHSQTHRQTLREGRTQSNTKHTVKHIGKHFGMAVYNKLPLTAVLNIASLTWWKPTWQRCLWSLLFLIIEVNIQVEGCPCPNLWWFATEAHPRGSFFFHCPPVKTPCSKQWQMTWSHLINWSVNRWSALATSPRLCKTWLVMQIQQRKALVVAWQSGWSCLQSNCVVY